MGIVFCFLFLASQTINNSCYLENQKMGTSTISLSSTSFEIMDLSLIPHESIHISNDGNFSDYGFDGTGDIDQPYLIEGLSIITTDSFGIVVANTTKYFTVRNCYVDANYQGIYIIDIAEGTALITNNTCTDNIYSGIYIFLSSSINITSNICLNNKYGIQLDNSPSNKLINNTLTGGDMGIYVSDSETVTSINNTCVNNRFGTYFDKSNSALIDNNTYSDGGQTGISLIESSFAKVFNNKISDKETGIFSFQSYNTIIKNNTCFDNDYGMQLTSSSVTINNNTYSSNSYGLHLSHSYSNTSQNKYFNNSYGIYLFASSSSKINNNTFFDCGLFIQDYSVDDYVNYTIEYNSVNNKKLAYLINQDNLLITDTIYGQIFLVNCSKITVSNQDLSNTTRGLDVLFCKEIALQNNTCSFNYIDGIHLSDSTDCILLNNSCNFNSKNGIYLYSTSGITHVSNNTCISNQEDGIHLYNSDDVIFIQNNCSLNLNDGIDLSYSDSCLIYNNSLTANIAYGVFLNSNSDMNTIHHNKFIENNIGGSSQAWDEGFSNAWFDISTSEGNFWSDWSEVGPYEIDGSANSVDLYPLDIYGNPPSVSEFSLMYGISIIFLLNLFVIVYISKKKRKSFY